MRELLPNSAPIKARFPRVLAAAAVIAASALLAACGTARSASNSTAAVSEQAQEQKAETTFADYAKCLREHGIHAEALSHGIKVGGPGGPDSSAAAVKAAEKACARYAPPP